MNRFPAAALVTSGLCVVLGSLVAPSASAAPPTNASSMQPGIHSTILNPEVGLEWSVDTWDATIADVREAGFTNIIIQQVALRADAGRAEVVYPSTVDGTTQTRDSAGEPYDLLGTILPLAREHGLTVRIGLFRDEASWFEDLRPASDDAELTTSLADDIWTQYRGYRDVIDGWYLPAEVNVNMIASPHRDAIIDYFDRTVTHLHRKDGGMSVMSSPYFNAYAGQTPHGWAKLWRDILHRADIDIIALQDGTGDPFGATEREQIDADLATWFAATRQGISDARSHARLWDNVNLYQRTGAAADLDEVAANMRAADAYVSGYTSFGYFSCFAPWAVGTDTMHERFVAWN